ncbi:MAG TPA: sulfotransferase family 2 domain-containing protein [Acidimicrobiia bacterium]|nr:sulfotransferase family 2 domain-containing protein [Acidimicrobiia bacterium]
MIVSHRHRFIFVKTRKTAGTSIEVLLDPIAGDDAIVTPVDPPVAGHGARNYKVPSRPLRAILWRARRRARGTTHPAYFNHISLQGIERQLGRRPVDSYFTFCFERNPWDKAVSGYFFAKGRGQFDGTFREYVLEGELPSDFDKYSRDGETVGVDFVGRYEHLDEDVRVAFDRIGLQHPVSLTREKGNFRPADARADALFDDEMSRRIESVFAREIRAFGYVRPVDLTSPGAREGAPGSS